MFRLDKEDIFIIATLGVVGIVCWYIIFSYIKDTARKECLEGELERSRIPFFHFDCKGLRK